jgi:hypothetical protein
MNYIWTKLKTGKMYRKKLESGCKKKTRKEGTKHSWVVDTLDCPQEQTNKTKALTRQEHKQKSCNAQASKTKLGSNYPDII